MNEDFYAMSSRLGKEYWSFNQKYEEYKDSRKESETIQEALLQLEESKKKYPENSTLRSRLDEQIKKLKEQTSIVVDIEEKFKNVKQDFLELTATTFEIDPKNEKKLSEDYINALTNIFFGKSKETLEFHECTIASKGVTVVDDEIRALMICTNICDFVRNVANDKLGKPNFIEEFWNRISKDEKMFKIFSILAEKGTIMNAKEISTIISDSAWNRKLVNDNLMNLLRDTLFNHKLIMRVERGKYKISDIGQYLWKEFGPKKQTEGEEMSEQPSKLSRLNKWTT